MTDTPRMPGWGETVGRIATRTLAIEPLHPTQGGKPTLILFFGSAAHPLVAQALALVAANRVLFDDVAATFYGVTIDPGDAAQGRIAQQLPGIRFFADYDRTLSRRFAVMEDDGGYAPTWLLLDRTWRVAGEFHLPDGDAAFAALRHLIDDAPGPDWAPVVMVPNVLEPELCRELIALHEGANHASGVMRELDGETRQVFDSGSKVRRDHYIHGGPVAEQLVARLIHRVGPMIQRCFQYEMLHVERLVIGCYDAEEGGHFRAHRDNTTTGTVHRQFAVTMNLNAEEYEGGDLSFPEFGPRTYRAPTGGAIVFSCALLHQVAPVTRGRRYALLPFLFDAERYKVREANLSRINRTPLYVDAGVATAPA